MKVQPVAGVGCCAVRLMSARHPTPGTFLISVHGYQLYKKLLRAVEQKTDHLQDTDKSHIMLVVFFFIYHLTWFHINKKNPTAVKHNTTISCGNVCRESQWPGDLFRMRGHVRGAKMGQNSKNMQVHVHRETGLKQNMTHYKVSLLHHEFGWSTAQFSVTDMV